MAFDRSSGILLHPTSLPSQHGIGDLGPAAYEFVDFLYAARQSLWQVLPLNPVGIGNSPYSATSAFAGNPLLISLERLAERGWIAAERLKGLPDHPDKVHYSEVISAKLPLVYEAARSFVKQATPDDRRRFQDFCYLNGWWLEDYALFEVLREHYRQQCWCDWPAELARREPKALSEARERYAAEIETVRAIQFAFFEQWRSLKSYCGRKDVKIIGDVAIFVNYDSADVWMRPDLFHLDENLKPISVAGVPPDFFSETGQRWGNPLYRWELLRELGYEWWIQRMRWTLQTCDIVRLDHFRGFEAFWSIPAAEETAMHGAWVEGPKGALFDALRNALGKLPFIAEDLGVITPGVVALREHYEMPGMRVLQFGFSNRGAHIFLPHSFEKNTVVYSGTHDNDTTLGWWRSAATEKEKQAVLHYFSPAKGDGEEVVWAFIRAAETSVADLCVLPMQDILVLGSEARMNVPSQGDGNWSWRMKKAAASRALAKKLGALTEIADRDHPQKLVSPNSGDADPKVAGNLEGADEDGNGEAGEYFPA